MATTLSLDNNTWDLVLDDLGNITTKSDKAQIAQDVSSSVRVWEGEDIWNVARGLPYKYLIMGKNATQSNLSAYMRQEAKRIAGVKDCRVVIGENNNRTQNINLLITTEDGEVIDGRV